MRTEKYFNNRTKELGFSVEPLMENGKIKHYCLYDSDFQWFGRFIPSDGNEPTYYAIDLDKTFNTMSELVEAISEFNKTRLCPAKCYGDYGIKSMGIEMAFDWYTELLGYKRSDDFRECNNSRIMKNIWGNAISKIYLSIKPEKTKGNVCIFNESSMISTSFEGVEDVIKAINSLVTPELLLNAAISIKAVGSRIGSIDMSKVEETNVMLEVKNMKDEIKKALEDALKSLE